MSFATGLFGTHVGRCASQLAVNQVILFPNRQPKVGHIRRGFCSFEQNVSGLHVSMDQPPVVGMVKGLCDDCQQLRRCIMAWAILFDAISERLPFDELGDNVDRAVFRSARVIHWDNIRMIQAGDRAGFGQILFGIFRLLESFSGGNLDGDLSLKLLVVGQINSPKRSFTQHTLQSIPAKLTVAYRPVANKGRRGREAVLLTVSTRSQFGQLAA